MDKNKIDTKTDEEMMNVWKDVIRQAIQFKGKFQPNIFNKTTNINRSSSMIDIKITD
jgi:hypothetical protein